MKVWLYFENQALIARSGIGRALKLQQEALAHTTVDAVTQKDATADVLHINTYGIRSFATLRFARRHGQKIVYHAHSTYEDFRNSFIGSNLLAPLYGWYLKQLYRRADHLITPTPYAKQLLRNYGLTQPITPLSNGIDLAQYAPDAHKVAAFRDYFELNAQQKVVMSVGLFFARKGILDFVALAKRHPEWTFIWFGYTDLHLIPRDIRRIVQGQHPDNLIFPGYITGDVLEGAFQGADAFVYPSYEETEGIVVLEALASKQNVIVRDIPVYADWLLDGQNVHKAKDLEMFDDKLTQLLAGQLPSVVQAGYEVAQQRDLPVIGQKLARVYEDVIQQN